MAREYIVVMKKSSPSRETRPLISIATWVLSRLSRGPVGSPVKPWMPVQARYRGQTGGRRPEFYNLIIDQFEVESNQRYRKNRQGHNETYCNIFVWDVTRAMGAEIPHWVDDAGDPAVALTGRETTANDAVSWLTMHGERFGWREVDMLTAQELANMGQPVVAVWLNNASAGHMAVVRPGQLSEQGPTMAQAGEADSRLIQAGNAFPTAWQNRQVAYFTHD
ncbi:MAG: hypothetical protein GEU75_02665 [Dehalococcoidia bacterium]|nr:hypothetical protein [Dehalococcoidia bacterium]